jgi:2-iminobutanoate/2-iminopropanoate deaminase
MKQILFSADLPGSPLYSQGIRVGNTVYLSGIIAFDPETKKVEAKAIEEQTERTIRNCELILKTGGASLEDVVQVVILLKDPQDFDSMNRAYAKIFSKISPREPWRDSGRHSEHTCVGHDDRSNPMIR